MGEPTRRKYTLQDVLQMVREDAEFSLAFWKRFPHAILSHHAQVRHVIADTERLDGPIENYIAHKNESLYRELFPGKDLPDPRNHPESTLSFPSYDEALDIVESMIASDVFQREFKSWLDELYREIYLKGKDPYRPDVFGGDKPQRNTTRYVRTRFSELSLETGKDFGPGCERVELPLAEDKPLAVYDCYAVLVPIGRNFHHDKEAQRQYDGTGSFMRSICPVATMTVYPVDDEYSRTRQPMKRIDALLKRSTTFQKLDPELQIEIASKRHAGELGAPVVTAIGQPFTPSPSRRGLRVRYDGIGEGENVVLTFNEKGMQMLVEREDGNTMKATVKSAKHLSQLLEAKTTAGETARIVAGWLPDLERIFDKVQPMFSAKDPSASLYAGPETAISLTDMFAQAPNDDGHDGKGDDDMPSL